MLEREGVMKKKRPHGGARSPGPASVARGDRTAFIPDPDDGPAVAPDDLAEELAEDFIASATSGEEIADERPDEVEPEEQGGPFVPSSANEEFAAGTDASNPKGAEPAPFPRTLGES
jgi:hypothetical protein